MKQQQTLISLALSALALLLAVWVIALNSSNRSLTKDYNEKMQNEVKTKKPEFDKGPVSQQIGTNIIRDMASVALKPENGAIKEVLSKRGLTVNPAPSPTPAGTSTPAPTGASVPATKPTDAPAAPELKQP